MNIKVAINAVTRIVDAKVPIEQLYRAVQPAAKGAGIKLGTFTAGAGYLQWALDGEGWTAFKDLDENEKGRVATTFIERRDHAIAALKGAQVARDVFTVPGDEFLFVRENGVDLEISLAAWAYRYPERGTGLELNTWRNNVVLQAVNIIFLWNGLPLPNVPFMLEGRPHFTDLEGIFHVDRPLPAGKSYRVSTSHSAKPGSGEPEMSFTVEAGKENYEFDLTQWMTVEVLVNEDNRRAEGCECTVTFGQTDHKLSTDASGRATLRLPLVADMTGHLAELQPQCTATCRNQEKSFVPMNAGEYHVFEFNFETDVTEEPEPPVVVNEPQKPAVADPEPPKLKSPVSITILDYEGFPVVEMPVVITTPHGNYRLTTGEKGELTLPPDAVEPKEKIKISFTVTPEYQEKHDIHYRKKKK